MGTGAVYVSADKVHEILICLDGCGGSVANDELGHADGVIRHTAFLVGSKPLAA